MNLKPSYEINYKGYTYPGEDALDAHPDIPESNNDYYNHPKVASFDMLIKQLAFHTKSIKDGTQDFIYTKFDVLPDFIFIEHNNSWAYYPADSEAPHMYPTYSFQVDNICYSIKRYADLSDMDIRDILLAQTIENYLNLKIS